MQASTAFGMEPLGLLAYRAFVGFRGEGPFGAEGPKSGVKGLELEGL